MPTCRAIRRSTACRDSSRAAAKSARASAASRSANPSSTLSASIDPTFSGRLTARITPDNSAEVEEALFQRQGARSDGATLRAGRFLSSIGYLNSPACARLGLLRCAAGLPGILRRPDAHRRDPAALAGADRALSSNSASKPGPVAAFPGTESSRNGIGSAALFAHLGDDIGDSASWRAGVSYLLTGPRPHLRRHRRDRQPVTNAFSRRQPHLGRRRHLQVGARRQCAARRASSCRASTSGAPNSGTLVHDSRRPPAAPAAAIARRQSGWYLQAVYQFMPQWRAGLRYDRLDSGTPRHRPGVVGRPSAADFPDPAERATVARDRDGRLLAVRVQPASPAGCRRTAALRPHRPADLPAIHHEPRCAWRPQLLRTSP